MYYCDILIETWDLMRPLAPRRRCAVEAWLGRRAACGHEIPWSVCKTSKTDTPHITHRRVLWFVCRGLWGRESSERKLRANGMDRDVGTWRVWDIMGENTTGQRNCSEQNLFKCLPKLLTLGNFFTRQINSSIPNRDSCLFEAEKYMSCTQA